MTKSAVSFFFYVIGGAVALLLLLTWPVFSMPAEPQDREYKMSQDRRGDRDHRGACGTYRKCE